MYWKWDHFVFQLNYGWESIGFDLFIHRSGIEFELNCIICGIYFSIWNSY